MLPAWQWQPVLVIGKRCLRNYDDVNVIDSDHCLVCAANPSEKDTSQCTPKQRYLCFRSVPSATVHIRQQETLRALAKRRRQQVPPLFR